MEGGLLAVVLAVGIPVGILVFLAGFLVLFYSIFAQAIGWNALAQRYKAIVEPEARSSLGRRLRLAPAAGVISAPQAPAGADPVV